MKGCTLLVAAAMAAGVAAMAPPVEFCYGFGYKWSTGETFEVDNQFNNQDVINSLNTLCGKGDAECKKWTTCGLNDWCGALALPPDSYLDGVDAKPKVGFAPFKASAAAKALASCQRQLDLQGIDDECKVVESYCRS